jgi:ribose-phosphate pyrophosphokinase
MNTQLLNLSQNFTPFGEGISHKTFSFPSGCEPHIKLENVTAEKVIITTRIQASDDLVILLLATDALKRCGVKNIEVFIPYLPFARQDRVMVKGEPLSLRVISGLLNLQGYSKVVVFDPHSEVALALINNVEAIDNHSFAKRVLKDKQDYFICSPDAGAYKKIFKLCQSLNYQNEIILCNKVRDVTNGNIKSITIDIGDLKSKDVYIVDDICDGGGTFLGIAQELKKRNCGKINLIVSHGIFSKGEEILKKDFHKIYTTDSFKDIVSEFIMQVKLSDVIKN